MIIICNKGKKNNKNWGSVETNLLKLLYYNKTDVSQSVLCHNPSAI